MPANRKRWVLALCSYIGFLLGLFTAALGPSLGELAKRNGAELGAMGSVFTALFVGALLAQLASGPLSDARGRRAVLVGGLALLAAGASALCLSTALPLALAAVVVAGLGHGSSDLMILVLAAKTYPEKSVSALNILGLLFGAGAFVGPALVGLSQRLSGSALPVLWFAAAAHALAVPLVLAVLEPE
ncbi:MAG TPA: MFS transporter, partial [Spirochaetales bacterium]|nr:MFS transporter [Spirochaetales bacterium]